MKNLIANYKIELPFQLLVCIPDQDKLEFISTIDDYMVKANFIKDESWSSQLKDEINWSYGISEILVTVARNEDVDPPNPQIAREEYLNYWKKRKPEYQDVALKIVNRILRYFKYKLHTPLVYELSNNDFGIRNPEWTDETGKHIPSGGEIVVLPIPGMGKYKLGAKRLTPDDYPNFQASIEVPFDTDLYEELLSDAQASFFQDNIRMSVLEMAIACETFVKSFYFDNNNLSSIAFDYFEDKSRFNIKVIELIDNVAKRAFGESFKEAHADDLHNIDYLFRARNKIAHRGKLIYRDDAGITITVSMEIAEAWWCSIQTLIKWLSERGERAG